MSSSSGSELWTRSVAGRLPVNDIEDRLDRIERAVDSIALEVERISEGQRFVTKLMSESRQLGAGAAEFIKVRQPDAEGVERR